MHGWRAGQRDRHSFICWSTSVAEQERLFNDGIIFLSSKGILGGASFSKLGFQGLSKVALRTLRFQHKVGTGFTRRPDKVKQTDYTLLPGY